MNELRKNYKTFEEGLKDYIASCKMEDAVFRYY